ncbi:MAG: hypothetical protein HOP25_00390 [Methylotenera sp.]|nr:hypothetical protein [Methylotenera sp.]
MSLEAIKRRSKSQNENKPNPQWVSERNASFRAFECINQFKVEKLQYISVHNQIKDYKNKKSFQITASEIARKTNTAVTTLISTSVYSIGLKSYIDEVNLELLKAKEKKISIHQKSYSSSLKQQKKDEIRIQLQNTIFELENLKKKNALDQARLILSSIPLPIKHKLGIF